MQGSHPVIGSFSSSPSRPDRVSLLPSAGHSALSPYIYLEISSGIQSRRFGIIYVHVLRTHNSDSNGSRAMGSTVPVDVNRQCADHTG
jgi:hypothetical protein